jgi:hypothetical protein
MASPPLKLVEGKLLVSVTQLRTMRRCFQHWAFENVHRRIPNKPAASRDCGKAGHSGLEALYKSRLAGSPSAEADMHAGLAAAWPTAPMHPDDEWRTLLRYQQALDGYVEHWRGEELQTLAVELAGEVELGEVSMPIPENIEHNAWAGCGPGSEATRPTHHRIPVTLRFVLDRVVLWDNVVYVVDAKFKGRWDETSVQNEYKRDPQFKLYAWALGQLQATRPDLKLGTVAKGALLDAIIVREPLSEATAAKAAKSEAYAAKLRPRTEYRRLRFAYYDWELEESRQMTLGWVRLAVEQAAAGSFLQNESSCAYYFGRGACPFLEVCSVPVEQRAMVLASDYFMDKVESGKFDKSEEVAE